MTSYFTGGTELRTSLRWSLILRASPCAWTLISATASASGDRSQASSFGRRKLVREESGEAAGPGADIDHVPDFPVGG
jgi:hypothetical protein